ncbi:MAG TPA: hypothetical protein DCZ97_00780, partial [Syntrophus sp. (in: bacteria)]|nr:hypothetical protein [Syntrophus sp. (in: bacteria)]
ALKNKESYIQSEAAGALGKIVEHLIAALKDKNPVVRSDAAVALGKTMDVRAVEPLIAALKDETYSVQRHAADALAGIGAPAVEPLIAALKDKDPSVRIGAAGALEKIKDTRAVDHLVAALRAENIEIIAGAYPFFIQRGVPGSEALLIKALDTYGARTPWMAQDFLNCGNDRLAKAVEGWVLKYNYGIDTSPSHSGPRWGK